MPVPAGPSSVVSVDEVKSRLRKTAVNVAGDDKIQSMINAAEAYYSRVVGPISGTVTETHDGGGTAIVLNASNVSAVTALSYGDGSTVDVDDLDLNTSNGILYWRYGTAGYFTNGSRNVSVTYTVGTLDADHREAIIADVAGYFAATQRAGEPREGADGYADGYYSNPMNLFPRIRGLAAPAIA